MFGGIPDPGAAWLQKVTGPGVPAEVPRSTLTEPGLYDSAGKCVTASQAWLPPLNGRIVRAS